VCFLSVVFNQHSYDSHSPALKKWDRRKRSRFCGLTRGAGVEYPVWNLACELENLVRFPPETTDFSLHQTAHVRTQPPYSSGVQAASSYSMGDVCSFAKGKTAESVKQTTHHYLVPRLRMSGAIPLFPIRFHAEHS
jgi:hypothetical protein